MHMYSHRTQVLLSAEQAARVKRIADREGRSVGAVIRSAVDAYVAPTADERTRALRSLLRLEAPVDDWETMKRDIIRGATGDR